MNSGACRPESDLKKLTADGIDWKQFYRAERTTPEAARNIAEWVRKAAATEDAALIECIRKGAVLSFPHTTLATAGPVDARAVAALHRAGLERILLLGVLHRGSLPRQAQDSFRVALEPNTNPDALRAALRGIGGALIPPPPVDRLRPCLMNWNPTGTSLLRTDRLAITSREFSLDTFLAILAAYMEHVPSFSPELLPIYVGVTRTPGIPHVDVSENIAAKLSTLRASSTALVVTGDLIHYGPFYGVDVPDNRAVDDRDRYAFRLLRDRLQATLAQTLFEGGVDDTAFRYLTELANDQRFILPIVTAWLGPHASVRLLSLEMVDYAGILGVPRPCFVASALAVYLPDPAGVDSRR